MERIAQYKNIIIAVLIAAALYVAYTTFFGASTTETLLVADPGAPAGAQALSSAGAPSVGRELVALLNDLQQIRFDGTIFSDPLFGSFEDFTQEIKEEPVGRKNPFEAL